MLADALVLMEGARSVTLHAVWVQWTWSPRARRWRPPRRPRRTVPAPWRGVCETVIQVHGGIGNTWERLAHVYLRRALLSSDILGDVGATSHECSATEVSAVMMDFGDSPEESEFRSLRAWLQENNPGLRSSSTR